MEGTKEIPSDPKSGTGVVSDFRISGNDRFQLQTETLCRNDNPNEKKTCFLINFADRELSCEVELPGRKAETRELLSGKVYSGKKLALTFAPYETMVFSCR